MDNNGIISEMQLRQKDSPPASSCIWQVLQETLEGRGERGEDVAIISLNLFTCSK